MENLANTIVQKCACCENRSLDVIYLTDCGYQACQARRAAWSEGMSDMCRKGFLHNAASPLCGFLHFLHLLASHEWATQPLLVDPSGAMAASQVDAAFATFRHRRQTGNVPPCYLITPYDPESRQWTADMLVGDLARAAHLANESLSAVHRSLLAYPGPSRCARSTAL
jgi:Nrap protein PAP/OAS1-like domain 5